MRRGTIGIIISLDSDVLVLLFASSPAILGLLLVVEKGLAFVVDGCHHDDPSHPFKFLNDRDEGVRDWSRGLPRSS